MSEKIPGGLAKGMGLADIAKYHKMPVKSLKTKLEQGIKTEMEHTTDKDVAREIAMDHIYEDPNYYSKLKKLETEGTCGYDTDATTGKKLNTPGGLDEASQQTNYTNPNFNAEWEEAIRYPEFKEMGKDGWLKTANQGKPVFYSSIKDKLGNVDLDFEGLEEPKKQRFLDALKKGTIEMPIAIKFSDSDYDLVAGNTRLSGLIKNGIDPKIWVVDISNIQKKKNKDPFGLNQFARELAMGLEEADPKTGTGKKPKGSSRRLYTDEDPSDTVGVKFSTKQDIIDTLSKASFKSKSHARQSQIINLIHQRVRAAYERAKDPDVKRRLKTALDYAEQRKEASKDKTQRLKQLKEIGDASAQIFDYDKNQIKTILDQIIQKKTRNNKLIFNSSQGQYEVYILVMEIKYIGYDILNKLIYNQYAPGIEYRKNFDPKTLNFLNTIKIQNSKVYPKDYNFLLLKAHEYFEYFKEKGILNEIPYKLSIRIDFSFKESSDNTNLNEQYKVLSTITDIIKELIKEINKYPYIDAEIIFESKADEDNATPNSNSKRGKFYEKYLEKNLSNLPGNWKYAKDNYGFILTNSDKEKEFEETLKKAFLTTLNETKGSAIPYGSGYKKLIPEITKFMLDKGMNLRPLPKVKFIEDDKENAEDILGRTAFYNPNEKSISLFTLGRHPKDILRSFCHEMIHHMQNIEDRLPAFSTTNTQEDSALNDIEEEAHKLGSMLMREFEDTIKK
jgi:hypothetical protein